MILNAAGGELDCRQVWIMGQVRNIGMTDQWRNTQEQTMRDTVCPEII